MIKKSGSLFLSGIKIHPSWANFLSQEMIDLIINIESKMIALDGDSMQAITPSPNRVLRFLELPVNELKVIVLGQDPYPQAGVATGRAFEVGTLKSWTDTYRNPSLKNMIRAIYRAYTNEIKTYNELKKEMGQRFVLPAPELAFDNWEKQGALFLNTAFTCKIDHPNSHTKIWQPFTHELLKFIASESPSATWLLWGNNALSITEGVDAKNTIFAYHPSRCNPRPKDFLHGELNGFELTKHQIEWAQILDTPDLFTTYLPNQ